MILNEVMKDTADAIREKTGKSEKIAPINFAEEIKSISAGGGESGDWEYYDFRTLIPQSDGGLGEMAPLLMYCGVRAELKALRGYYTSHQWWFTARGSYADIATILDSGQDDYDGPVYIAIDLSQRIKSTRSTGLVDLSYREILSADSTHPQWNIIEICRQGMPLITALLNATKISKEEWERDDYTGVILE